jgi:predicted type IV restriction endonuclease
MEFIDQLTALSTRALKQKDIIKTEEATKNALVMPFIQALGYDIFDPSEVIPEFTADVGSKKGEKVDYAIVADGQLSMLFECKCCGFNLNDCHASQLRRYFHVTTARISVLTNGTIYRFYSDLEEPNKMDEKPFMEVNLLDIDSQIIPELKKLTKSSFELDKMLLTANDLKYTREIKNLLEGEFASPSQDFVKLVLGSVYVGLKTQPVIEQFTPIVKQAINLLINGRINDRLKSALSRDEEKAVSPEEDTLSPRPNDVITTQDELDGFYIVRAILHEIVDVSRVVHRDNKSYFGILLDNNNRKPLCRLHFNTSQKYIGLFAADKTETKHPIQGLNELYNYASQIKETVRYYDQAQ